MDYEQKYKEALERAKDYYKANQKLGDSDENEVLSDIFPELKESEDEMIRKTLIEYFNAYPKDCYCELKTSSIIAWLEKQGQQPKKVSIWKHWKDGIAGNGEGKQIYLTKTGNIYDISSSLGCECDYIELSELDKLKLDVSIPNMEEEK